MSGKTTMGPAAAHVAHLIPLAQQAAQHTAQHTCSPVQNHNAKQLLAELSTAAARSCCAAGCDACRWDEQNALLVESHERVIAELAEEAEAKLAEEVLAAEGLRQEKEGLEKEAAEVNERINE
jgi:hypothetical protein